MTTQVLYWVIALAVIGVGGFWLYLEGKYKNQVRLKEIVNGRVIVRDYKAAYFEDIDKSAWWKIAGEKDKTKKLIPIPPEEAIEINHKGKKFVEGYRFETGEVVFIKDSLNVKQPPTFSEPPKDIQKKIDAESDQTEKRKILDQWKKDSELKWRKDNNVVTPYQPVTTNQRMGYFNNIKKTEMRKGFDWKSQIIPITAISGFVIIVLALIVMFGEIAQPVLEADKISENQFQMQKEIVTILKEIKLDQQVIHGEVEQIKSNLQDTEPQPIGE